MAKNGEMTEQEFDSRHYEIIEWYKMWNRLFWIFAVLFFICLFTGNLNPALIILFSQTLLMIFMQICLRRHHKLHREMEAQDGEQR